MTLKSIGFFESAQIEAYHAGRGPDLMGLCGKIKLHSGENFEQALQDVDGCSHLWIIFGFHLNLNSNQNHNLNWKPQVSAPRSNKKIGVFATRAPYRPNPVGLSLVTLIQVKGLTLEIGPNDILNGSPIFDIKPFHPEYDIAPNAKIDWLDSATFKKNIISFSPFAESQLNFLETNGVTELRTFIIRQLEFDPTNKNKKRVEQQPHYWVLAYRTWRVDFTFSENKIGVLSISSGYTEQELLEFKNNYTDKYADKNIHRLFCKEFR